MAETLLEEGQVLESTTVKIYRTAKVVKGGRRFSFSAQVVVGDRKGRVGLGYGKAPGVPAAIEKAQKEARKSLHNITLQEGTIPHEVTSKFGAAVVKLIPAAPGTGVIAGATVRAVLEFAGIRDCLTKSFGTNNQKNLLRATLNGLLQLRTRANTSELRGVEIAETEVDERLEAGRRFAPAPTTTAAPPRKPKPAQKRDKAAKPAAPKAKAELEQAEPAAQGEATPQAEAQQPAPNQQDQPDQNAATGQNETTDQNAATDQNDVTEDKT